MTNVLETAAAPGPLLGESRLLAGWQRTERSDLGAHLATFGPMPPPAPKEVALLALADSGLTGRGGAGFSTARKIESLLGSQRRPILVVNAMEGEPASHKDETLLACAPHLVLDGAEAVASIIGAWRIVVAVPEDRPHMASGIEAALLERGAKDPRVGEPGIRVYLGPSRYITGEESALARWVGGGPALPTFRPQKGRPPMAGRNPALVSNAETLAHAALVARYGPAWFRQVGTADAPGTTLVTVLWSRGYSVLEVPLGIPLESVLVRGGVKGAVRALLIGGYGGAWIAPVLESPYTSSHLRRFGASVGPGIIAVLDDRACGLAETARVARYLASQSAGQCGPCMFGLPAIAQDMDDLARGRLDRRGLERLRVRLRAVTGRGACGHPNGAARLVSSALEVFADDVATHLRSSPCRFAGAKPLLPVPGIPIRRSAR